MKSRATTYLLILVVTVVWGIVMWKIFAREPDGSLVNTPARVVKSAAKEAADTLLLNYRDPFLGHSSVTIAPAKPRLAGKPAPPPAPKPPPPDIKYIGRISRGGAQHCLLEKNGILHTVKINETIAGYRLVVIHTDSVRLQSKDDKLTIHRAS